MSGRTAHPRVGVRQAARPATAPDPGRPIERTIAVNAGTLVCPRRGTVQAFTCDTCAFFCRSEAEPDSVICSHPIPARETFAARSRRNEAVRIALSYRLERT